MQCQHEPVILALAAARKNVSAAQFLLRWSLEVGIPVLVGSTNLDHIRQDMDVFNFTLTRSEMQLIDQMMSYGDLNQDTTLLLDMHFSGTDGAQR
jgi:diketogulonate reductase-like aldo/keto reductase